MALVSGSMCGNIRYAYDECWVALVSASVVTSADDDGTGSRGSRQQAGRTPLGRGE